jgi:hypothetical protein
MQQCNVTSNLSSEKPKSCRPLDLNVLIVTLNNRVQAHLESLKKTNSYARMCYRFHLFEFPPLLTSFVSFHPTQGHPFEVFRTHFNNCLQHGFKVWQQNVPLPKCILISICLLVLQLGPLLYSSSFSINPSYHLSFLNTTYLLY